jgi:hypothetical protein
LHLDEHDLERKTPTTQALHLSTFPFAWIANSGEGTVSKIDTQTGVEVARYRTGPNGAADSPSRTAVDADGDALTITIFSYRLAVAWYGR